ncbi:MAG: T9SS type A sorting domain-containing protein, partial [Ignavibacteria bacterium]|nr:T9SS type A sorting domain-containing protein [Ignavibacteria bacterium]
PFENLFRSGDKDNTQHSSNTVETSLSNYPNPFNPKTRITFGLNQRSDVSIMIYDISGRLVKDLYRGTNEAGEYSVDFDASDLPSGIYYSVLTAGSMTVKNRMALVK